MRISKKKSSLFEWKLSHCEGVYRGFVLVCKKFDIEKCWDLAHFKKYTQLNAMKKIEKFAWNVIYLIAATENFFWSFNNLNKKKLILNFFKFSFISFISYVKNFKLMFDWFLKKWYLLFILQLKNFYFNFSFKNLISLHLFFFKSAFRDRKKQNWF